MQTMRTKTIFFLVDGIADFPTSNSPLRVSQKPFLNYLIKNKKAFLTYIFPLEKKYWPKYGEFSVSGLANLGILGYKIKPDIFKRGPYEALGSGIKYKNGWLAFRINFASVDSNLKVIDRRIGRNTYGLEILERDINKIKFKTPFIFKRTIGHRGVLIFKDSLSDKITFNDPLGNGKKVKKIKPLSNNKLAFKTAEILNNFLLKVYELLKDHPINKKRIQKNILPANYILLREGGVKVLKLKNFFQRFKFKNGVVLSALGVDLGTSISVGFKKYVLPESNTINDEFKNILLALNKVMNKYELIYVHVKKADEAAHDKNFQKKKEFFEKFDAFLAKIYNDKIKYAITGDHITSVKTGKHAFGPVPLLIVNSFLVNNPQEFSEKEAIKMGKFFAFNAQIWKFLKNDRP